MQTQVLVVGAGPAGSAAAYSLARHGVGVVLADQCTFPRDKTCGDGISPAGVRVLMRIGVLDPAELTRGKRRLFSGVRIVAPGGASVDLHYPWPSQQTGFGQGCVIPRSELDAMLVERAIAAGATFLPGFRAMEPIWSSGRVAGLGGVCHGSATAVKADVTIVATGARLHLLRALGLCDPAPPFTVGVRQYLRLPTDAFPGSYLRVYLEPNLLPDYAWVFPIDDRLVNVGLASAGHWRVQGKNSLTALLGTFVGGTSAAAGSLAGAVPVGPPTGTPLRADFLRRKTCAAGVLVAGEAAGLVDPLTGEGISFALQSGELAAEVAYRATLAHEFERALCTYERALRQRFAAYFCFAWQLRSRLSDPRLANALVSDPGRPAQPSPHLGLGVAYCAAGAPLCAPVAACPGPLTLPGISDDGHPLPPDRTVTGKRRESRRRRLCFHFVPELQLVQAVEQPVQRQQLVVCPRLYDLATIDHIDHVGMLDSGYAVCDHENRPPAHQDS